MRARTVGEQDGVGDAMAWEHGMMTDGKMRRSAASRSASRRAGVPMMQAADLGDGDDLASRLRLDFSRIRQVAPQRQMRVAFICRR